MPEYLEQKVSSSSSEQVANSLKGKILFSQTNHHLYQSSIRPLTLDSLPDNVRNFVEQTAKMCSPKDIHLCDGSEAENRLILDRLQATGTIVPLPKYKNCWLARTDPRDVARVESKTFISTKDKRDTVPRTKEGVKGQLGNWISPEDMDKAVRDRFPACMKNRTMYVIPFSMGPVGSPLSKVGVQLTDSPYVVASMRIMTRMGPEVLKAIVASGGEGIVKALHSVGGNGSDVKLPCPGWPCDPERTIILHRPENNEIVSFGSGYGGNSLLGKKCFALRIGSTIAKREGWLAEHMLILGVTPPNGPKKYIAAAFPSACGKTNLAMMLPALEGFKVECVGDDIAWIKYNPKTKMLHAINPEKGFFGVAPGTSSKTNPNAMATIFENTVFTNVAETSDGGVWWEGMEGPEEGVTLKDWLGKPYNGQGNAAHPNSRFCAPAGQCPIIDPAWEAAEGVPLSAILFGGRRPQGVPLVYESLSWSHGVFVGASMRSEATAAAEHKAKVVMHDPFAMRPFFGYNFGHYLQHWLDMENLPGVTLPKIFHVNWFRKGSDGKFLWPGFGDNIRVLDWVLRRVEGSGKAVRSPIGLLPPKDGLNLEGLAGIVRTEELLSVPKDFWRQEAAEIRKYFEEQLPEDLPPRIKEELEALETRIRDS